MPQNLKYRAGTGHAERFKTSGDPYLHRGMFAAADTAGTEQSVHFPSVAKSVAVHNPAANTGSFKLRVSFAPNSDADVSSSLNGTGSSIVIGTGESFSIDGRCRYIYVSTDGVPGADCYYHITAELTNIKITNYPLTGEGIDA